MIFGEGIPGVIRAGRRPYYLSPEFEGYYDPDPYEIGKCEDKEVSEFVGGDFRVGIMRVLSTSELQSVGFSIPTPD